MKRRLEQRNHQTPRRDSPPRAVAEEAQQEQQLVGLLD